MGGMKGKEKWRPDRTSAPEGWLRGGRVSHNRRDPQEAWIWGSTPSISPAQSQGKSARLLGRVLCPQRSPLGRVGPECIRGRPGENRRGRWERSRGRLPLPLGLREPAELPGGSSAL